MNTTRGGAQPDRTLYSQIRSVLPTTRPPLPYYCGTVQGFKVILVNGHDVKLRERSGGKTPHDPQAQDFMDFVEGGNGYEDPELCAKDEVYVDGLTDASEWPYTCYHEIHEATLMRDQGLTYNKAHASANRHEKQLRQGH